MHFELIIDLIMFLSLKLNTDLRTHYLLYICNMDSLISHWPTFIIIILFLNIIYVATLLKMNIIIKLDLINIITSKHLITISIHVLTT